MSDKSKPINHIDLETVIKNLPGNVYWKNRDGVYLGCNQMQADAMGVQIDGFVGKTIFALVRQDLAQKVHDTDERIMSTGNTEVIEEYGPRALDGTIVPYLSHKIPLIQNNKIIGLLGSSLDISELKKIQESHIITAKKSETELEKSQALLQSIVDQLPEHIYWVDTNSRVLGCNKEQALQFGVNFNEIRGMSILDIGEKFNWNKELTNNIRKNDLWVIKHKKRKITEEKLLIKGEEKFYLSYKDPLLDENDQVIGVIGVSIDITHRKQLEAKLIEQKNAAEQANLSKTDFITNVSHDLRTPCSGIVGLSNMLLETETDPNKRKTIQSLSQSANILFNILNDGISAIKEDDFIYQGIPTNKNFDLMTLLNNTIKLITPMAMTKKLELNTNFDATLPRYISSYPEIIQKISNNLLSNAVKFTDSGTVTFKAYRKKINNDTFLTLEITDTGIGIPPDQIEHIFDKYKKLTTSYQQAEHTGLGLGLYFVKALLDKIDGTITINSKLGCGTTFTCLIPYTAADNTTSQPYGKTKNNYTQIPIHSGDTVLIAEDDPIAQQIAKYILEQLGAQVTIASTGQQTLQLAKSYSPTLILVDIGLPDMTGLELSVKLLELYKTETIKPIIVGLSAHLDEDKKEEAISHGMSDLWLKPISKGYFTG